MGKMLTDERDINVPTRKLTWYLNKEIRKNIQEGIYSNIREATTKNQRRRIFEFQAFIDFYMWNFRITINV